MQTITPNLWFDHNAEEAVNYYLSVFPGSKVTAEQRYPDSAAEGLADFQQDLAGQILMMNFTLAGHDFMAINAGPEFTPTPANSFMVNFDPKTDSQAAEHIDEVWAKLSEGGEVRMPIQEYPFSKRYGWVQDRYGYNWQLILTNPEGDDRPCIIPSLMFGGPQQGQAAAARQYYLDTFKDSRPGNVAEYPEDTGPAKKGDVMFSDFCLNGEWFTAMDSGAEQDFTFNEAVSYMVTCQDQAEIDYYWDKLSAHPANEQCGWCKDKFGVSWQIVPANMDVLMQKPDAFAKMMQMKKIIIDEF